MTIVLSRVKEERVKGLVKGVSVVIPVYNSEQSLEPLFARIQSVLEGEGLEFEVILVDDGSADQSWQVIRSLAANSTKVLGLRMLRNYGQHNALLCGIRQARHAVVVTMDDDLQNPPEEIPGLLARMEEGFDVVYGTPNKDKHGFLRGAAPRLTKLVLQRSMGAETAESISALGPSGPS